MCGGSGGGDSGAGAIYTANMEREQRERDRQDEQARADAATAASDASKVEQRNTFNTAMANTDAYGRYVYQTYIQERGLPYDANQEANVVNSIKAQIPDLATNPEKYFTSESIGQGLDTIAQGTRDRLGNQVSSTFAPGFEKTLIADTADDPYLASILGEQKATAQKVVDFNKARGLLNDTGYQTAVGTLGTQGAAAQSTLSGIGESVLGKSWQALNDIKGEAGLAAAGYSHGQAEPNIGSYYTRAQEKATSDLAGLEGSIRGAVGGTNFFDAPTALQTGGTMQGPINLTTRPTGPGGIQVAEAKKNQRGLGSTGVF